ncbi:coiled-coil domain-containing protein [Nisaea nitritireducens]|uniref:hypothetical protein n=1 Tax=Nisaea nitritireducens TaxID=568392 RepID=UPI001867FE4B|nr:hypothetical protein [Nisaea nitritireducens]
MAQSLEDLLIQIDASTENLRRELKRADESVSGFSRTTERAVDQIERELAKTGRAFSSLQQNIDRANKIGNEHAANTQRQAQNIAAYGAEMDRLRAKHNPLFAAQQQYKAQLDELSRALKVGALNQGEYGAALARTKAQFADQIRNMNAVRAASRISSAAIAKGSKAYQQYGAVAQQAGYQIGDFAVQVASGQSAVVAFTQQASQLLGFFGPVGAVAGAAAAILGGIYLAFGRTSEEAKKADRAIQDLAKTLADYRVEVQKATSLGQDFDDDLGGVPDRLKSQYQRTLETTLDIESKNLRDLNEQLDDLQKRRGEFEATRRGERGPSSTIDEGAYKQTKADIEEVTKQIDAAIDRSESMQAQLNTLSTLRFEDPGFEEVTGYSSNLAAQLAAATDRLEALRSGGLEGAAAFDMLAKAEGIAERQAEAYNDANEDAINSGQLKKKTADDYLLTAKILVNVEKAAADLTENLTNSDKEHAAAIEAKTKAIDKEFAAYEKLLDHTAEVRDGAERDIANTLEMAAAYTSGSEAARVLAKEHELLAKNTNLSAEEIRDLAERTVDAEDRMDQMRASSVYLSDTLSNSFDGIGNAITEAFAKGEIAALDMGSVWKAVVSEMVQSGIALSALNPAKNAVFGTNLPTLTTVFGGSSGASGFQLPSFGLGGIGNSIVTSSFGEAIGLSAFDIGVGDLVPTGLGNAFTGGLGAAPYGIIGSLLGQFLGLGSGNAILDTGLGAAGSFLGGAAGSAFIGGAAGGPIGAILGAFAASALGSLFEDKDYPFAKGDVNLSGGGLSFTTDSLDDGDEQGAAQLTQAVVAGLQGFLTSSGGTLTGDLNRIATIGYASGRSDALGHGFFAGGAGDFATGADFTNLEDSGLAVALSIRQGILKAIDEGTLEGVSQEFMDAVSTGIRNSATDNAEQLAADIDFSVFYGQIVAGIEDPLTAVEQTFQGIADQAEAASTQAERLGLALEPVVDHFAELTTEAVRAVENDLERQIRSLSGQGYLNTLEDIVAAYDFNSKSAAAAGIGTDKIDRLFSLQVSNALSGVDGVDHGLVADVFAQAGVNLPAAALYEAQYRATLDQIEALEANTDATDDVSRRFLAIADSRLTDERFSPLDPRARLDAARAEFDRLLGLATDGTDDPETRDALQRIEAADAAFLEASIAYYGKAGGYWGDFNYSQDALRQIANDNFSVADRQLSELQQANTHLEHLAAIIENLGGTVPGGGAAAAAGASAGGAAVAASTGGGSVSGNVVTLPSGVTDTAPNLVSRAAAYIERYPDLLAAFGANNYGAAWQHWERHGKEEGRTFHTGGYPYPGEMFRALPDEILVQAPAAGQMRVLDPKQSEDYRSKSEIVTGLKVMEAGLNNLALLVEQLIQRNAAGQRAIAVAVEKGSDAQEILAAHAERAVG